MTPGDLRYIDIPILTEGDKGFITKKVEKNIDRFWKGGPGWTGKAIRYLGCKGYPLVSYIDKSNERVEGSVKEFLEFVWGKTSYDGMKPEFKEAIENQVGVIVTVKPDITADDTAKYIVDAVQAEAMLSDISTKNLAGLGVHEDKKSFSQSLGEKIPWMAVGGLILYLATHNNIIR